MSLSEGRPESIAALNRMDATEFWHYFLSWQKRQKAIEESYSKK